MGPEHRMGMMRMYFHFGLGDLFLFKGFVLDSGQAMCIVCLLVFLGAILIEAIDYTRGYLSCRCMELANYNGQQRKSSCDQLIDGGLSPNPQVMGAPSELGPPKCCSGSGGASKKGEISTTTSRTATTTTTTIGDNDYCHRYRKETKFLPNFYGPVGVVPFRIRLLQSGLQFVRTGLSLVLMLVAMTYNVCLIFPIMFGG